MRAATTLHVYDTDPTLYDELMRVFGEAVSGTTAWVNFTTDAGVAVTFFRVDAPAEELTDADHELAETVA
jgi:hypothetical protein